MRLSIVRTRFEKPIELDLRLVQSTGQIEGPSAQQPLGDPGLRVWGIEQICALRLDETFEVVRKKLGPEFGPETAPAGVVLAGGTAKIPGIVECATRAFGVPARLAEFSPGLTENLRDPAYSAVLGVLSYGFNAAAEESAAAPRQPSVLGKLAQLFRA